MTTKIHHATMKKAEALGITDLVINPVTGNAECTFDGGFYEHESPKDLVALIALSQEDGEKGDEAQNELEDHRVDDDALGDEGTEEDGEAEDGEAEDGEGGDEGRSVVKRRYKVRYKPHHDRCGDEMASAFSAYVTHQVTIIRETKTKGPKEVLEARIDPELLSEVCQANGVDLGRWEGRNMGMKRMNAGNVLRGKLRHGAEVVIGDQHFKIEGEG